MAFSAFAGNFAINTSTGNQAITGIGFTPKIVLFYPTIQTADGVVVDAYFGFGVAISSTERSAICANSEDAQPTSDCSSETTDVLCILMDDVGASSTLYAADFVTQDGDGFTVNVTTAPGSGFRVGFLALGGDDLTDVAIGNFGAATSDGNQSISGVGFQPEAMLAFGIRNLAAAASATQFFPSLGGAVSNTKQFAIIGHSQGGQGTSNTNRRGSNDAVFYEFGSILASSLSVITYFFLPCPFIKCLKVSW